MKTKLTSAILLLGLLQSTQGWAFRFSPMVSTFASSGPEATQTFLVENNNGEKIALQIETFHREVDENGKETRKETDDFTIFPQQMVLEPGERRSIRLTWTGTRDPKTELAYRLVVSQVPVDLKKPEQRKLGANITFLLQYVASIYVSPGQGDSRIVIDSVKPAKDRKLALTIKNTGTAHRVLKGSHVYLKTGDGVEGIRRIELTSKKLNELEAENVLSGHSRKFQLELPSGVDGATISEKNIEIDFESK